MSAANTRGQWLVPMLQGACRLLLRALSVRVVVRGAHGREPALFMANHLSWLDVVAVLAHVPCTFVAKREVQTWPFLGWLGRRLGVVWVDRARKRDLLHSVPALQAQLEAGRSVLLFPEGTTSVGAQLLPFKSALVEAAVRAQVRVVPLAITASARGETDALAWTGDETLWASLPRVSALRDAQIGLHFAPAVAPGEPRKQLTARARAAIERRTIGGAIRSRPVDDAADAARAAAGLSLSARLGNLRSSATGFLVALLIGVSFLYAQTPMYEFVPAAPFRGPAWYNPYAVPRGDTLRWYRANLHAHSAGWGGLTAGRQSPREVSARYRALHTDIIGISNYHAAPDRREAGTFPVYEHGWNIQKAHRLALGATDVDWFDYPLGATVHQQQHLIDRLHANASLVAIAHPALRDGHGPDDLRRLANYELLEVLNHFLPPADSAWDAALSSGRPVWLLAGDDSHDVEGTGETGTNYTRILAPSPADRDVVEALRMGRAYGVRATHHRATLELDRMSMEHDTFTVALHGALRAVRVVGQDGKVRARWYRTGVPSDTAVVLRTVASAGDGYLRVVAEGPDEWLYTNPVVRWNGVAFAAGLAVPSGRRTALYQAAWVVLYAWLAAGLLVGVLTGRSPRARRLTPLPPRA